jgi:peptidoglycan hydrolase CwlO-like protein
MCKKVLIAVLAVGIGLLVVSPKVRSLARVKWNRATTWANKQVSPDTKIDALRLRLQDLERDDERHYDLVARQEREVSLRQEKVKKLQAEVKKQEVRLQEMTAAAKERTTGQVSYNGKDWEREFFQDTLRKDYRALQSVEKVLKSEQKVLTTLAQTAATNRQKLGELEATRNEMLARLTDLERQLAEERLAATRNHAVLDDVSYTRLNKDIDDLAGEFDIQKRKRELRGQPARSTIRAHDEEKARREAIDREINARFGGQPAPVVNGN